MPVAEASQTESELWMVQLRCPGETRLDMLPQNVMGISSHFEYHPFFFTDFKEQKCVWKHAEHRSVECMTDAQKHFHMDCGFMRASALDYQCSNKVSEGVIMSFDGFTSYLLIVDETSRHMWVFLTITKDPHLWT